MIYLELLLGFLQVGCFAFGGAYAAIPLIRDVVLSYGWITEEKLSYMIAIAESTPGPIMVNLATYIGSEQGGILGAAIATTSVILPAFLIMILAVVVLNKAIKNRYVQATLAAITPCIIGIIFATGAEMTIHAITGMWEILLGAVLAVILFGARFVLKKKISTIAFIGISAVLGVLVFSFV
ncbi:MAG: chromate transporter [Ruminococcaceae bacterium]|nr:chromate transporter [Oscillospiraceae bacterium]